MSYPSLDDVIAALEKRAEHDRELAPSETSRWYYALQAQADTLEELAEILAEGDLSELDDWAEGETR